MNTLLKKATTLKEVYRLFDPVRGLSKPEELENFYVDRNSHIREKIQFALDNDLEFNEPVHLLFTGHRGSGKSTEINKLCADLDDKFFIVKVSFNNRPDVDYIDVLLKAAMTLFKTATDAEVIKKAPAQIMEDLWKNLNDFLKDKLFKGMNISRDLNGVVSFTAKVNYLIFECEGKFEREPESRNEIKKGSMELLSEITDKVNLISSMIRDKYQKPVLFVFEDADKIDLAYSKDIFYQHANALINIRASAIYVIDIALRYGGSFATIQSNFAEFICLPNIKLLTSDNKLVSENISLLEKVINYRAENHLFESEAKNLLIASSGGLIRTLISLIQNAASTAAIEKSECITKKYVEHAINRQRGDFIAMLRSEHYPLLANRHQDKKLSNDEDTQTLLQSLALLEYENGKLWCDVHPIILPEVIERTAG